MTLLWSMLVLFAFTPLWLFSILIALFFLILAVNNRLVLKLYEAHKALSPKRTISLYSTLLIGDLCAESVYKEYLSDNGKTLMLTAPRRSLEADYQILLHSVSALHENGTCIIIGSKYDKGISLFDVPYLSLTTRKELKVETLLRRSHYPLFFEPLRSLLYFVSTNNKYYLKECPHPDMRKFCDKRNIHLVYLMIER